eukprot:jgi/Mesen1/10107/ME000075S09613
MGYSLEDALGAPPGEFLKVHRLPSRFLKMALQRRMVGDQLEHNRKVSKAELTKQLGWFSMAPAVVLSLLIASVTAATSALIYSEFAVEFVAIAQIYRRYAPDFGEPLSAASRCLSNQAVVLLLRLWQRLLLLLVVAKVDLECVWPGLNGGNKEGGKAGPFWSTRKQSSWELFANIHLAQSHGTYSNQMGTSLHTPYRLAACEEPSSGVMSRSFGACHSKNMTRPL